MTRLFKLEGHYFDPNPPWPKAPIYCFIAQHKVVNFKQLHWLSISTNRCILDSNSVNSHSKNSVTITPLTQKLPSLGFKAKLRLIPCMLFALVKRSSVAKNRQLSSLHFFSTIIAKILGCDSWVVRNVNRSRLLCERSLGNFMTLVAASM